MVNNLALDFQYTLVGYSAVGVILLLLASYGAVTLMWRPFLISAAIMAAVTTYTLVTHGSRAGAGLGGHRLHRARDLGRHPLRAHERR